MVNDKPANKNLEDNSGLLDSVRLEYEETGKKPKRINKKQIEENAKKMERDFRKQAKETKMQKQKNQLTKAVIITITITVSVMCSYVGVFYAGKLYNQYELMDAKNKLEALNQ